MGFELNKDESPDHDLMKKRGQFIGKLYALRQQFANIDPIVHTKLVSIYLTSFYGSPLWDLSSEAAKRLYSSWNIMMKIAYDIPRESKTFLIEPISETSHIKQKLLKRFLKFHRTLGESDKPHVNYLRNIQQNDLRSTFGKNVKHIIQELGVDCIELANINNYVYSPISQNDEWKISLIKECLEMRAGRLESNLTQKEITSIVNSISV